MTDERIIVLDNIEGIARLSGKDQHGNQWIQFEVSFAEQEPDECSICGVSLDYGWLCLDGGEEVCDTHIQFASDNV